MISSSRLGTCTFFVVISVALSRPRVQRRHIYIYIYISPSSGCLRSRSIRYLPVELASKACACHHWKLENPEASLELASFCEVAAKMQENDLPLGVVEQPGRELYVSGGGGMGGVGGAPTQRRNADLMRPPTREHRHHLHHIQICRVFQYSCICRCICMCTCV